MAEGTRQAVQKSSQSSSGRINNNGNSSSSSNNATTATAGTKRKRGRTISNPILSEHMKEVCNMYNSGKSPAQISGMLVIKHGLSPEECTRKRVSDTIKYAKKNSLYNVQSTSPATTSLLATGNGDGPQGVSTCTIDFQY